jgi:protein required for attachment to host cells
MPIHIVVADESSARIYEVAHRHDLQNPSGPWSLVGELDDPASRLHDRDFKSDRPGRSTEHGALEAHRRGAVARHAVGAEQHPHKREAQQFALRIAGTIAQAQQTQRANQLVLVAEPHFLGLLRAALPAQLRELVAHEIHHDLRHAPESTVREHLAAEVAAGRL